MSKCENERALEFMNAELRAACEANGITTDNVLGVYSSILYNEGSRDADRLRAIEMFSKWAGYAAPEKKDITIHEIQIGDEGPDDLDV